MIVLGLLALAPCGRELSLDAWLRRRRGLSPLDPSAPAWPLWLLRFECAVVYGASGFSKLVDPDWFGGTVTWQRVTRAQDELDGLPDWLVSVAHGPWLPHRRGQVRRAHRAVHRARAVVARHSLRRRLGRRRLPPVDRGLGVGAGLLAARNRRARWSGRCRPRATGCSASTRAWLASEGSPRPCARSTGSPASASSPAPRLELVDRDGTAFAGMPAVVFALSRLPLTAWFALPVLLLPEVRRARRVGSGARSGGGGRADMSRVWRAGLVLALLLVLVFGVGAPPERCPTVSPEELQRSAQAAVDWFVRNQEPDGDWLYEYDVRDDSVSPEYNEVRHAGVTMGLYQAAAAGLPGALRSADRGTEWALGTARGGRRLGGVQLQRAHHDGRHRAARRRARDPPRGHRGRSLRRGAAPPRALPRRPDGAVRRRARGVRRGQRRAGARPVLEVLHGRGLLGARTPPPHLPRRGLGTGRGPNRRVPGDLARRGRGPLAPDSRPLGGLRPGRDRGVPRPRRPAAERRRARLRARAGRDVRHAGALPRPALRPVGRGGARRLRAARRLVRRRRRGDHGLVADRAGGCQARRPERAARRARHLRRGARRRRAVHGRRRRGRRRRRSGWRAPGSSTARPAWTTSSTRSPDCCGRSRSRRRPARRPPATTRRRAGSGPPCCCWR